MRLVMWINSYFFGEEKATKWDAILYISAIIILYAMIRRYFVE